MSFLMGGQAKVQQPQSAAALTIQQSSYGVPLQLLYGTNRVYGNLVWYGDFQSVQQSAAGGKGGIVGGGGKGGGGSTFQYYASFVIGLCEGPIQSIGDIYVSKQITELTQLNGALFTGTQGQAPWGYLTTNHPDQALGYTEMAYVAFPGFSLGTSSETPQFSFETFGQFVFSATIQDCSPDDFMVDFLTRCGLSSAYIDTFALLATYCQANNFFISPYMDQQRTAIDWLTEIMTTLNSEFVWLPSQGYLTAVPYGDTPVSGNGVNYVPNLSPIYEISEDDFIRDGDVDPITCTRADLADVYNQVPIEYVNRGDQYNVETYQAFDDTLVDVYGFRTASTLRAHHITDPVVAQTMAQLWMNRQIYVRNTFEFKLPWNYILLDPMDMISIDEPNMGLIDSLVRVVSIEEDEKDGMLTFNCEEVPDAIAGSTVYPNFGTTRSLPNYNQAPGNVNAPIMFEAPLALLQAANIEIDIALSGGNAIWGGCDIWVSNDGVTYTFLSQFNGACRMGDLTSILPTFVPSPGSNNIDTTSTLAIDMTESRGSFNSAATPADAVTFNSLCYVDGELISFGSDILTASFEYNLTYLNRGCYGSTVGAHAIGSQFARLDSSIFRYQVDQTRVGQTIYFKFVSFNVWGGGLQEISEVAPYTYTVLGTALLTPLGNPTALSVSYLDNIGQLNWQPVTDIRSPILYEIRKGTSFASSQIVATTAQTNYPVYGTDTYWVSALYYTPTGTAVYSATPPSIGVTTPSLTQYLIDTWDEAGTGWTGTLSGAAALVSGNIEVIGSANLLAAPNILTIPNLLSYAAASGIYTAPSGHIIKSNYIMNAKVIIDWTLSAISSTSDVTAITDIPSTADITGAVSNSLVLAQPQINLSQDGGSTWGGWQNWVPGVYTFNAIDFQIIIYSLSLTVTAILSDLAITVDVPLRTDTGTSASSNLVDTTVAYPNGEFNVTPNLQITIQSSVAGDDLITTSIGQTNFAYSVYNGGVRVIRTISYSAQGY